MTDSYVYVIIALLPLAAVMLVFQVNPYHALVMRAILGAIAALVYAVLGAADVALTEALVGTMLAITLYVVAVRSSLVMRLGLLEGEDFAEHIASLRKVINQYHLHLELVEYSNLQALERALIAKEVHAICTKSEPSELDNRPDRIAIRVHRLFEIMQSELVPGTALTYVSVPKVEEKH